MKEYAVIFSHGAGVDVDGYSGLNPNDARRRDKAVFSTHQEAADHRNAREIAQPTMSFTVCEFEA